MRGVMKVRAKKGWVRQIYQEISEQEVSEEKEGQERENIKKNSVFVCNVLNYTYTGLFKEQGQFLKVSVRNHSNYASKTIRNYHFKNLRV